VQNKKGVYFRAVQEAQRKSQELQSPPLEPTPPPIPPLPIIPMPEAAPEAPPPLPDQELLTTVALPVIPPSGGGYKVTARRFIRISRGESAKNGR